MARQCTPEDIVQPFKPGPLTETTILAVSNWVLDSILIAGGSISTAYLCAGHMAHGLEAELRKREATRPTPRADDGGSE